MSSFSPDQMVLAKHAWSNGFLSYCRIPILAPTNGFKLKRVPLLNAPSGDKTF